MPYFVNYVCNDMRFSSGPFDSKEEADRELGRLAEEAHHAVSELEVTKTQVPYHAG
jgi:hypothetical protein